MGDNAFSTLFALILEYFKGDIRKACYWFESENPHLGRTTPLQMIAMGREHKLGKFIRSQLEGNVP